jgi:hypothetical protein
MLSLRLREVVVIREDILEWASYDEKVSLPFPLISYLG